MNYKDLLEEFLKFEFENKLFSINIDNVPVWELIRITVFNKLRSIKLEPNTAISSFNFKNSFLVLLDYLKNSIFNNPFSIKKKIEILYLGHPRRQKLFDNKYWDIYIDPIILESSFEYVVIEGYANLNKSHFYPPKTNKIYYLDFIQFPLNIISKIILRNKSFKKEISELENKIIEYFNVDKHCLELDKIISAILIKWKLGIKVINRLLLKINPKVIISVVSYSFYNQLFTFVAHNLGIPTIELQHGTVGKYHIAYNFYENKSIKTFPKYFFAWGAAWVSNSRFPIKKENVKIIGFPYLSSQLIKQINVRKKKQILVLSQYRDDIGYFAKELAEKLKDFQIIFKSHPAEELIINKKYSYFHNLNNLLVVSNKSLHKLASESNYVFGVNSTSLIEATQFCNHVGVIKLPGWEYFEEFEGKSDLMFFEDTEAVISMINNFEPTKSIKSKITFFKKYSNKEFHALLADIIK